MPAYKVMIFIDFWNFSLPLEKIIMADGKNHYGRWKKIFDQLV